MSIRKLGDDHRLKPFIAAHFDVQAYIKSVIKDGSSEETYDIITNSVEEVNAEIKGYITQHKDSLMSGMQDVAALATKYQALHSMSTKLLRNVEKLKKDALHSYDLVQTRTSQLERMHATSTALRLLRQFVHLKFQLDHHLKNNSRDSKDADPRHLASIAKIVSELEGLVNQNGVSCVKIVLDQVPVIRNYGQQLRQVAQEKLLQALRERSQSTVATCLQIFYNLNSLPEVLLLAIDSTVRHTLELSKHSLDLEVLVAAYPELLVQTASTPGASNVTGGTSALQKPTPTPKKESQAAANASISQLRATLRELSHQWASQVYEQTMHILVLQRVMAKKEDPSSHKRFVEVLRSGSTGAHPMLASCQLVQLFWERLGVALQDLCMEEMRLYAMAGARLYPSLRRAAVEILGSIQTMMEGDAQGVSRDSDVHTSQGINPGKEGMFGCSLLNQEDLLSYLSLGSRPKSTAVTSALLKTTQSSQQASHTTATKKTFQSLGVHDNASRITAGGEVDVEQPLLSGLKPIRDRYLGQLLTRMTGPVYQMFPEMEGFAAAVPSKRDLQLLIGVIQAELLVAVVESEHSLVKAVCKEAIKAVQLLLSKAEGMIRTGNETRRVAPQQNFARNSQQEHNGQLVTLLSQLHDALLKLPQQTVKSAQDVLALIPGMNTMFSTSSISLPTSTPVKNPMDLVHEEILLSMEGAIFYVDELVINQLIVPIVDYMVNYCRTILMGLLKEGAVSGEEISCSRSVQTLLKQVPDLLKSHLQTLPKGKAVTSGIEEFLLRLLATYVSIAALLRPVSEGVRLRTAKDMAALETFAQSQGLTDSSVGVLGGFTRPHLHNNQNQNQQNGVIAEFKAFRRLLFSDEDHSQSTGSSMNNTSLSIAPSKTRILSLPYISSLRPSTLLGHLTASAPPQLPNIYEGLRMSTEEYLEMLFTFDSNPSQDREVRKSSGSSSSISTLFSPNNNNWIKIPSEVRCWEGVKECVDILLQRATAAEGATQKNLHAWGEAIRDIGEAQFPQSIR